MRLTMSKILITVLVSGIFAFSNVQAQGVMKDPVSFKLKNGITVVVAENSGMGKVFAAVKMEGNTFTHKEGVATVLGNVLNEIALSKTEKAFENDGKENRPKVSLNAEEGNVTASPADFESAFWAMSSALQQPALDQVALDKISQNGAKDISLAEVNTFYWQQVNPSTVSITIVGDITVGQAKALAKKAFGDWKENKEASLAR